MFNVLLIDDEELALVTLQHALPWKEYGFTSIHSTASSCDALELLRKKHFDACFVDIRMPHINGLDLIAAAQQYKLDTIFVIVSGYSDFSYAKQAIHYGVLDYCLKPVITEDCIPVLEKLFSNLYFKRSSCDPLYVSKLLTDKTLCQDFLSRLAMNNTECTELLLLQVHSKDLLMVLKQLDKLLPEQVLFLDSEKAMLIWKDYVDTDNFSLLLSECLQSPAFSLYITCPLNVDSFQSSIRLLNIKFQNEDVTQNKIIKMHITNDQISVFFSDILCYIENNYADQLTLKELSEKFCTNYSYLSSLFKRNVGLSFVEHLNKIRLNHACKLLVDTNISIQNISVAVGFNDYHYFCNTFKKCYSITPTQYRISHRKEINV